MSEDAKKKGARLPSVKNLFSSKRFRYGGFSLFMIIVVVAVVILVNVGVTAIDDNWNLKLDVTSNQFFQLSAQTTQIMRGLTQPVKFIALFQEANQTNSTVELLNRYRAMNPGLIEVEIVDPVRNPTYTNQFNTDGSGIAEGSVVVTNADESRFRVVEYESMYELEFDTTTYQQYAKAFIGEQALTNATVFVSSADQQKVYFLTEHNEVPFSQYSGHVQGPIEQLNIEVGEIGLTGLNTLAPGDILVVNAPQRDLSTDEREQLKSFLETGGNLLYMRNGGDDELTNFESLLSLYGVEVQHDLVIEPDQAKNLNGNPTVPIPDLLSGDITSPMTSSNLVAILPGASSFEISNVSQSTRTIAPMLQTSASSFGETNLDAIEQTPGEEDLPGPRTIGLTMEQTSGDGKTTTKIVALGNSLFISNTNIAAYSGNLDLFYNSVRWLQGSSSAVSIVGKNLLTSRLNITSTMHFYLLAGLCVVVIPLILIVSGTVVWLRRRHL